MRVGRRGAGARHAADADREDAPAAESRVGIEAQIETARGLINVEEICAACDRLETIIFGPADFAASTEMPVLTGGVQIPEYPGDHFHYVFSKILMAGRANGLQVIDGPFLKIRELDALRDYSMRCRILGYDGKWALHPDQVKVINEVFTPTQEQFDRAFDILEAYEKATTEGDRKGAVMFGDEMIDEASRKMANKFVMRGERAGMSRSRAARIAGAHLSSAPIGKPGADASLHVRPFQSSVSRAALPAERQGAQARERRGRLQRETSTRWNCRSEAGSRRAAAVTGGSTDAGLTAAGAVVVVVVVVVDGTATPGGKIVSCSTTEPVLPSAPLTVEASGRLAGPRRSSVS